MHTSDELPFPVDRLTPGTLVAEVVVEPETTPLLAAARERGCSIHGGLPMLLAQIDQVIEFLELGGRHPESGRR